MTFSKRYRERDSSCIIFVHGGGGNLWNSYRQFDWFKEKYTLISYNLSGYGRSSYREDQSLENHVEDLRKLIEKYGIRDVVVHGHSYGTEIALEYAKEYSPEGLVITGGGAFDLTPEWEKPLLKTLLALRFYKIPSNTWLMKKLASKALHPDTSEERVLDFLKSNPMPHRRSAWETVIKSFWSYDAENLHEINCPTAVIHGPEDGIVPIESARRTADKLSDSEFHEISKTGHVPMAERPEHYNQILEKFVDDHL
ncbi:alpha/beta fold hydrolase [Candidatus Nanohaloarchaea archaeon]|nr:alpha/beta fold hydrolase [Candidatus Nanohaloarchaea archaeon]